MSEIFPIRGDYDVDLEEPVVVELGSDKAEVYLDALSSKTTRDVFVELHGNPSTISDLSNEFEDSIQNIKYHVEKLQESNLVEETGTDYSEKGNEMNVYAPTNEAVVLLAGKEETKSNIKDSVKPMGAFAIISIVVSSVLAYQSKIESSINEPEKEPIQPSIQSESKDIRSDSTDIGTESTQEGPEVVSEFIIGFASLSPEIAILSVSLISILFGALLYHILIR